jgi:hypothetical protein
VARAFLFGFVVAALLALLAYRFYLQPGEPDPCRACSSGTRCAAGLCVVANAPAAPVVRRRGGQRSRPIASSSVGSSAGSSSSSGATGSQPIGSQPSPDPPPTAAPEPPPPPPPPPLSPQEKRLVTVGDKLTGTEVINLAEAGGGDHELSQEEIDAVFRPRQSAVVSCIDDARGEAQLESTITVAFRIRRSGEVAGVRIEAPSYLVSHGLADCVRRLVAPLHFPASSKAQIVTYPFSLR